MLAATIFKKKPFPPFIKNHRVFKVVKTVKKIFHEIGLANCKEEVEIDNKESITAAAKALITSIENHLRVKGIYHKGHLLTETAATIDNSCISWKDGIISLNLSKNVVDAQGKVVFKAGERLFRVYTKLATSFNKDHYNNWNSLACLQDLGAFKKFSSINIPSANKKFKICFSSDGVDGLWDIATMSMRGIVSCQRWDAPESKHLIGTMVDPFTGIIYLTSDTPTSHGSKMIRRSTVKFIVDSKKKRPAIGIERMYPDHDESTMQQFIAFIKRKTNNKFDVIDLYRKPVNNTFIPMSRTIASLEGGENTPYLDSDISYGDAPKITSKQEKAIARGIEEQIVLAARTIQLDKLHQDDCQWVRLLQAKNHNRLRRWISIEIVSGISDISSTVDSMSELISAIQEDYDRYWLMGHVKEGLYECYGLNRYRGAILSKIANLAIKNIQIYLKEEKAKLASEFPKKLPKNAPLYLKYV